MSLSGRELGNYCAAGSWGGIEANRDNYSLLAENYAKNAGDLLIVRLRVVGSNLRPRRPVRLFLFERNSDGQCGVGAAEEEGGEAEGQDGMAKADAEVFPEACPSAGVIGGEEQGEHED